MGFDTALILGLLAALLLLVIGFLLIVLGRRRGPQCFYCRDEGKVLRFGDGQYAKLHACPQCSDGRYLADTTYPAVTSGP